MSTGGRQVAVLLNCGHWYTTPHDEHSRSLTQGATTMCPHDTEEAIIDMAIVVLDSPTLVITT
jgi:hypothetical protein